MMIVISSSVASGGPIHALMASLWKCHEFSQDHVLVLGNFRLEKGPKKGLTGKPPGRPWEGELLNMSVHGEI